MTIINKYRTEIKWGVLFTIISLLWIAFEKLMGWHGPRIDKHANYTNIFAIIAIAVYVFALLDKRANELDGKMTWRQGFISGTIIGIVVAILSPLAQLITHKIISPEYFPNAIEYAVSSGNSTQEQAEQFFNLPYYMMQSAFGAVILGVITGAIVAIFARSKE
jgi:NADH:ubiquinone oxidoreductase subunit 3 (subunit A)